MGIEITVANVSQLRDGLWETELAPREVRTLGPCPSSIGGVTVLLVAKPTFDRATSAIRFAPQAVTVLNVGNTSRAIIVNGGDVAQAEAKPAAPAISSSPRHIRAGDDQYLRSLADLPDDLKRAGESILHQVREHFPGDLRAVGTRRFQETPDNFWFVTVQPRDESLSITVRGLPDRFHVARLKIVEDRRPYSRFKVRGMSDVPEAVQVILHAVRKRS